MNTSVVPSFALLCGLAGLVGGCATQPESHLVTAPPPTAPTASVQVVAAPPQQVFVTQSQPAVTATPGGTSYVVMQAPPAPQPPEAVPARPSSQHAWIPGYWTWRNNRYEWMAGHWEVPPHTNATWNNPRWVPEGGSYRFFEGYWN